MIHTFETMFKAKKRENKYKIFTSKVTPFQSQFPMSILLLQRHED